MKLVEYKPASLDDFIMENKPEILTTIDRCIQNDTMDLLLIGSVPKQIVPLIIEKYYQHVLKRIPNHAVLEVDCFRDLNLNSPNNEIVLFSKAHCSYKKFVVVYNLEQIPDNIQVYFKPIFKNVFFIFCTECQQKVYETILTRCIYIRFSPLGYENYKALLMYLSAQEEIEFENMEETIQQSGMNVDYILNLFNYTRLMRRTTLPAHHHYIQGIRDAQWALYFEHIKQKQTKTAFQMLFDYYDKGFSLLDIYYFMFDYAKRCLPNPYNYKLIQLLCEYIHHIYEGHDHKIGLVFLTNDINIIYSI